MHDFLCSFFAGSGLWKYILVVWLFGVVMSSDDCDDDYNEFVVVNVMSLWALYSA
jgi:hypothetical protein